MGAAHGWGPTGVPVRRRVCAKWIARLGWAAGVFCDQFLVSYRAGYSWSAARRGGQWAPRQRGPVD